MPNPLTELRRQTAEFTGPALAQLSGETIATAGAWRLTLELPGDPDGRLTEDEPEGPYLGAIVRLQHNGTTLQTDSLWGIFEDFGAAGSSHHPWWEQLAGIVRELADRCTDPVEVTGTIAGRIQTLQALQLEAASQKTPHRIPAK